MTRVLRYPRMSAAMCALVIACALLRDLCVSLALAGYARVLLHATFILLPVCMALLSCRFVVDAQGVSVGFLLHMKRTPWSEIAALGVFCCNSRRRYLYGMYHGKTDFLNMLHHAPACGAWGFAVPLSRKLLQAIHMYCPFGLNLSPLPAKQRRGRMRMQLRHAVSCVLLLLPLSISAAASGVTLLYLAAHDHASSVFMLTLLAILLFAAAVHMLSRTLNAVMTIPAFHESGICAGPGMYLAWEDVHFGYVHRIARMSGLYLLSRPYSEMQRRGASPVVCLSMPDTSTLLLAYLTYCPHAEKDMRGA